MKSQILAGLMVASLSGCAGFMAYEEGTPITQEEEQALVKGKTTTSEVKAFIGYPDEITQHGGMTQYIYNFTQINHLAPNVNEKVVLEFSEKGIFQKISRGKGKTNSNPLLGGV